MLAILSKDWGERKATKEKYLLARSWKTVGASKGHASSVASQYGDDPAAFRASVKYGA